MHWSEIFKYDSLFCLHQQRMQEETCCSGFTGLGIKCRRSMRPDGAHMSGGRGRRFCSQTTLMRKEGLHTGPSSWSETETERWFDSRAAASLLSPFQSLVWEQDNGFYSLDGTRRVEGWPLGACVDYKSKCHADCMGFDWSHQQRCQINSVCQK